ncbi:MAG: DUF1574 family protein [Candidatus Omnitrophota bacterium]
MEKNLFISSFKKMPKALLIAILFLFATEIVCRQNIRYIVNIGDYVLIYKRKHLTVKDKPYCDAIIIGDSRAMGINAKYVSTFVSQGLRRNFRIYNYSTPGFGVQGYYLLLKKYLKDNKKPKYLFFATRPVLLMGDADVEKKSNLGHRHRFFLFFSMADYIQSLSPVFFLKTLCLELERYSYLVTYRREIKNLFLQYVDEFKIKPKVSRDLIEERWGGYPYSLGRKAIPEGQSIDGFDYQQDFYVDPNALCWYEKFLELAGENQIKVVIFNLPIIEEFYDKHEKDGSNKKYKETIVNIADKYNHTVVLAPVLEPLQRKYFSDPGHLSELGLKEFDEVLARRILDFIASDQWL